MKFLITSVSKDESKAAVLEVETNDSGAVKKKSLREYAEALCRMAADSKEIAYLNRRCIPWALMREKERQLTEKVASDKADFAEIEDRTLQYMNEWLSKVCLLEFVPENEAEPIGILFGKFCRKHRINAQIKSLAVITVSP